VPRRKGERERTVYKEDRIMRIVASTLIALGFAGAMALSVPSAARAQGFYFQGPGVEFGVGRPWYRDRYYYRRDYDWPYAYYHRMTTGAGGTANIAGVTGTEV